MALLQVQKLLAPEDKMALQMITAQNRLAIQQETLDLRRTLGEANLGIREQGLGLREQGLGIQQQRLGLERERIAQGAEAGGSVFQPPGGGPPLWVAKGKATPIEGLPAGSTKAGTAKAGGEVSQTEVDFVANYVKTVGTWPPGMGRNKELMNRVTDQLGREGVDPTVIAQAAGSFRANQGSLTAATRLADAATSYERTALKNLDVATKALHGVAPTELGPLLNKWVESGETFAGNPQVPASLAAVVTFANEYAKVMSGATGAQAATEGARREAFDLFNPYFSAGQWDEVAKIAKQDMANREASLYDQVDIIRGRIGRGGSSAPEKTKPEAGQAAPPAGTGQNLDVTKEQYDKLPSGAAYTVPGDPTVRYKP
jgi:hypothetical protein